MLITPLNVLGVNYIKVNNIQKIKEKGFLPVPVLAVDGKIMDFVSALHWLKERNPENKKFSDLSQKTI